jgi:hypothetical protein
MSSTSEKIFQGSILSPFFCNIYLSSFDYYVNTQLFKNLRYNRNFYYYIFKDIKKFLDFSTLKNEKIFNKLEEDVKILLNNVKYRFQYVRYVGNFLCGFIGSKQLGYYILLLCSH